MKRLIITIFITISILYFWITLPPLVSFGAISFVQIATSTAYNGGTATTSTVSITPTTGDMLDAACFSWNSVGGLRTATISDTGSNTYTKYASSTETNNFLKVDAFSSKITSSGAITITCTLDGTSNNGINFSVIELSGASSTDVILSDKNGTTATVNTGNLTPTNSGDYIIGHIFSNIGESFSFTPTNQTLFTSVDKIDNTASTRVSNNWRGLASSTTAYDTGGTLGGTPTTWTAVVVSYMPTSSPAVASISTNQQFVSTFDD